MKRRPSVVMLWLFMLGRWLGRRTCVYAFMLGLEAGADDLCRERVPLPPPDDPT